MTNAPKRDPNALEGICIGVAFLVLMGFVFFREEWSALTSLAGRRDEELLGLLVAVFTAGAGLIYLVPSKAGKLGEKKKRIGIPSIAYGLGAGVCCFFAAGWLLSDFRADIATVFSHSLAESAFRFVKSVYAIAGCVVGVVIHSIVSGFGSKKRRCWIPDQPKETNTMVIGTVDEDKEIAKWVSIGKKGLTGNLLITGSIGSGKTQGAILPLFEQALLQFDRSSSILVIDPKRTFLEQAMKLVEFHGMQDRMMRISLKGDVTFNPIFYPDALRDSGFVRAAEMLRAAAMNHMGRDHDSSFWEQQMFNLIKRALIFCAAKSDYYTLTDVYETIVAAAKGSDISIELEKLLDDGKERSEEAVFNIKSSYKYFRDEYANLDDKVKTGILATASSYLNEFGEYQPSRIFCPPKEKLTITSMDTIVDEGKILFLDIERPALIRSMGTFLKLHYQQSVLDRLNSEIGRPKKPAFLFVDEYQEVVSSGHGATLGDDRFLSKSREADGVMIAAVQSLSSLGNTIRNEKAVKELVQNFRTRIALQSTDLSTIDAFKELWGKEDKIKVSESFSKTERIKGAATPFESPSGGSQSESMNRSPAREYIVEAKDFSTLTTCESFGQIYDGVYTKFQRIFLKPQFLKDKAIPHVDVLKLLASAVLFLFTLQSPKAHAFPNVCSVVKTPEFNSCLSFSVGTCMCGFPPHPCAHFSYYVPQTFLEVAPDKKSSHFDLLPGTAAQLGTVSKGVPFGAESDNGSYSNQSHAIAVPFATIPFELMPCGGSRVERFCFDAMSEHVDSHWRTGSGDSLQPNFLAWGVAPKACLIKGAIQGLSGMGEPSLSPMEGSCSVPMPWMTKFRPSSRSACNGWGVFYPRYGTYQGASSTAGALMIASRLKSLGSEVFQSIPESLDEKWQMISPQSSSCFREGENVGWLELKRVSEFGRLTSGKMKGHLFVTWKKVSCCREFPEVAVAAASIAAMTAACQVPGL